MTTLADLRPGDIGFGPIKGAAGLLVNAGQLILGEGFHVGSLDVRHIFVVTGSAGEFPGTIKHPMCVEAMPSGAREYSLKDRWTDEYAYVRLAEDYPGQAKDAAAIARAMIGTPYSFASYAALAAWRFGVKTPRLEKWIGRRRPGQDMPGNHPAIKARNEPIEIALPAEAICSVLADQAWSLAGKKIFTDGRPQQVVTPGALARRLFQMANRGEAEWMEPDVAVKRTTEWDET